MLISLPVRKSGVCTYSIQGRYLDKSKSETLNHGCPKTQRNAEFEKTIARVCHVTDVYRGDILNHDNRCLYKKKSILKYTMYARAAVAR